jgi:hypothetical protein
MSKDAKAVNVRFSCGNTTIMMRLSEWITPQLEVNSSGQYIALQWGRELRGGNAIRTMPRQFVHTQKCATRSRRFIATGFPTRRRNQTRLFLKATRLRPTAE